MQQVCLQQEAESLHMAGPNKSGDSKRPSLSLCPETLKEKPLLSEQLHCTDITRVEIVMNSAHPSPQADCIFA